MEMLIRDPRVHVIINLLKVKKCLPAPGLVEIIPESKSWFDELSTDGALFLLLFASRKDCLRLCNWSASS